MSPAHEVCHEQEWNEVDEGTVEVVPSQGFTLLGRRYERSYRKPRSNRESAPRKVVSNGMRSIYSVVPYTHSS